MAQSTTERMDAFQQQHRWLGFPIAVLYKFFDDQGSYLSALITYYGFLSLFPFLLLLTSILGLVLRNNPDLQQRILDSALSQFPVIGKDLHTPKAVGAGGAAIVLSSLTALYGGLGVAQAVQNAMNTAWAVPKNRRPNPIKARLRSMLLLATAGLAIIGATALSAVAQRANAFGGNFSGLVTLILTLAAIAVNAVVFLLAFRISTSHKLSVREALPGAITAAVLWQLLQMFGTSYVSHVVKNASNTNSISAVVLGLIAFLYLAANALVISVEVNVVLDKHLWPRALLTPFTDNVDLTHGDQKAYADAAKAQRNKGFETVDVSFENDGKNASAQQQAADGTAATAPDGAQGKAEGKAQDKAPETTSS